MNRKLAAQMKTLGRIVASGAIIAVLTGLSLACQVPVFRYALERWSPDSYRLIVVGNATELVQAKESVRSVVPESSRLVSVEFVPIDQVKDPLVLSRWKELHNDQSAVGFLFYPDKASSLRGKLAHSAVVEADKLKSIVASPARQELAKRLASGDSAVWILLESGDAAKDDAAFRTLEAQLAKDQDWLKIPTPEELEVTAEILEATKIKLKVSFSIVRVNRNDARESFLVDALLNSEEDLRGFDDPMAFPVFGRGIVLYALIGKGISPDTIRSASTFIAGPCSCQVKEQNPGFDLLMDYDWNAAIGDTLISQPAPGSGDSSAPPKLLKIPQGRSPK